MTTRIVPLLAVGLLLGCRPSDDRVNISGTVFVDEKPTGGVTVAFVGGDGATMGSTTTSADGTFTARVAPGKNQVAVSKDIPTVAAPVSNDPESQSMGTEEEVKKMMTNSPKQLIASKFADSKASGLSFDLQEGASIEIKVTSK